MIHFADAKTHIFHCLTSLKLGCILQTGLNSIGQLVILTKLSFPPYIETYTKAFARAHTHTHTHTVLCGKLQPSTTDSKSDLEKLECKEN